MGSGWSASQPGSNGPLRSLLCPIKVANAYFEPLLQRVQSPFGTAAYKVCPLASRRSLQRGFISWAHNVPHTMQCTEILLGKHLCSSLALTWIHPWPMAVPQMITCAESCNAPERRSGTRSSSTGCTTRRQSRALRERSPTSTPATPSTTHAPSALRTCASMSATSACPPRSPRFVESQAACSGDESILSGPTGRKLVLD